MEIMGVSRWRKSFVCPKFYEVDRNNNIIDLKGEASKKKK